MTTFSIYVPAKTADDWKALLAEPDKHWRTGYSARTLAYAWQASRNEFPPEILRMFAKSGDSNLANIEPVLGIVEHGVHMPGKGFSSKNDLFVLAKAANKLVSIVVEGKVSETFGPILQEWDSGSENKATRINGIQQLIGLTNAPALTIRYQLLHRMASAVVEAERFTASYAIMLIHSFSLKDKNFEDFRAFVGLYGQQAVPDQLIDLTEVQGIRLCTAWVHGDQKFLSS
jgi:hypothetical protein